MSAIRAVKYLIVGATSSRPLTDVPLVRNLVTLYNKLPHPVLLFLLFLQSFSWPTMPLITDDNASGN